MRPSVVHLYIQITFLNFHYELGENKNSPPPLSNKLYNTKMIESLNITAQTILIYKNIIEILKLTRSQAGYVRAKSTLHVCMFGWPNVVIKFTCDNSSDSINCLFLY